MKSKTIILALALLGAAGCSRGEDIPGFGEPLVLTETAKARRIAELHATPITESIQSNDAFPGPTWVAGRVDLPECSQCHKPGTVAKAPRTNPNERASHWEVAILHAEGMTCRTCHIPTEPANLAALTGTVGFDEAYVSCGTCHKEVLRDWRGAAHGKRLTGWAEPRVIQNCAGCHNPHKPKLEKRLPVAHPTIVPDRLKKKSPPKEPHHVSHSKLPSDLHSGGE